MRLVAPDERKKEKFLPRGEVLELVKPGWKYKVNIELKTGIFWYPELERMAVEEVRYQGVEDRVIYSSFNHYSIQKLKEYAPDAEQAYLYSDVILDVYRICKKNRSKRYPSGNLSYGDGRLSQRI